VTLEKRPAGIRRIGNGLSILAVYRDVPPLNGDDDFVCRRQVECAVNVRCRNADTAWQCLGSGTKDEANEAANLTRTGR